MQSSTPCQDAHAIVATADVLVIAVADGAGSASRSELGARVAADAAAEFVLRSWQSGHCADIVREALVFGRASLLEAAGDGDPSELATTLTVVMADGARVATAQVGDGAVVVRKADRYELLGPVERGEFLNETCFLTSSAWEEELRVDVISTNEDEQEVDGIAVMTDGLQLLALGLPAGDPHPGFFRPMFDWLAQQTPDPDELTAFLQSERVCARTDDDKTLVLAALAPAALP